MTGTRRWVLGGTVGVTVALVIAYLTQAFSDMIAHQGWINFIYTAPASASESFDHTRMIRLPTRSMQSTQRRLSSLRVLRHRFLYWRLGWSAPRACGCVFSFWRFSLP